MSNKTTVASRPVATLMALCGLAPAIAISQQIVLPVLPGQNAVQTAIGTAVATMCVNALDAQPNKPPPVLNSQQHDLHDQCHAIAGSVVTAAKGGGGAASALGALTQVSGNEISTQGALATRAVAGQFANISGRLTALRFGGNLSAGGNRVAANDAGGQSVFAPLASAGAQTPYRGTSMGDSYDQTGGFAPSFARYVPGQSQDGFVKAAFTSYDDDYSPRIVQSERSGGSSGTSNPWGTFLQASYTSGRHDATSNEDPFHFHSASVTAGVDYNFGTAVLGASVGYDRFEAGFRASGANVSGGNAEVKSTSGSLYGAWFGEHWTFNGIATYGKLTTNVSRIVNYTATYDTSKFADPQPDLSDQCVGTICTVSVNRTLKGDPDGRTLAVGATGGYQLSVYNWDIFPSVSVNYRRSTINSFTETDPNPPAGGDGLALAFNDQTVESTRSILGLDLSRPVSVAFGVVTPIVRVEWDHEYKTRARTIGAHYAFDPTAGSTCLSCFALPTDGSPANYGIAGLGLSVTLARRVQAFLYDEALFGFANYHSNSVALGIRSQF